MAHVCCEDLSNVLLLHEATKSGFCLFVSVLVFCVFMLLIMNGSRPVGATHRECLSYLSLKQLLEKV